MNMLMFILGLYINWVLLCTAISIFGLGIWKVLELIVIEHKRSIKQEQEYWSNMWNNL